MQTNGHDFIDILKIELNDEDDFIALEALLNEFEGPKRDGRRPPPYPFSGRDSLARKPRLPFGQILLTAKSEASGPLAAIFEKIQRMGMSPFFAGPSASKDALDVCYSSVLTVLFLMFPPVRIHQHPPRTQAQGGRGDSCSRRSSLGQYETLCTLSPIRIDATSSPYPRASFVLPVPLSCATSIVCSSLPAFSFSLAYCTSFVFVPIQLIDSTTASYGLTA